MHRGGALRVRGEIISPTVNGEEWDLVSVIAIIWFEDYTELPLSVDVERGRRRVGCGKGID